jgi:hypothetical protein
MYKEFKKETLLIIFIFISFLILNSSWWAWWGGACFGPRHLTPTIPFLILPLSYIINKTEKKLSRYVVIVLVLISIFINFAGLQAINDEVASKHSVNMAPEYKNKVNTFQIIQNPLFDYYLPLFLKQGPRSRIFEDVINFEPPDVRYSFLSQSEIFYSPPFLCLVPLLLVMFIIWCKEMTKLFVLYRWNIMALFVLCIFVLSLFQQKDEISFGTGWYSKEKTEKMRWMWKNGVISIFNFNKTKKKAKLHIVAESFHTNRNISIYLNGIFIKSIIIGSHTERDIIMFLEPGENLLRLHSQQPCTVIGTIEKNDDIRCVTIGMKSISIE